MTEQVRTIDRQRIGGVIAEAGQPAMREVDGWLRDFLNLP
jgi:mRNA-degrading endonuclease toxin of MazEF toxin-antitoxin module